jgi:hypothetical protein
MLGNFGGMRIIASEHMVDKQQAKTHHRKRINKKWLKRYGYITTPMKTVIMAGNTVYAHPSVVANLEREMSRRHQSF